MTNTANEQGFLTFSNPFTSEKTAEISNVKDTRIQRIANLLAQGSFAPVSNQVITLFMEAGGMDNLGGALNIKAVIALCMEISNSNNSIELWYDPFSGRLELSTEGKSDSLTIWAKRASKMAA